MLFLVQKYLNVSFWICLFWGAASVFAPAITPALRKELKSLAKGENGVSVNASSSANANSSIKAILRNHNLDPEDSEFYDFYNCYYKLHKIFQVIPDPDFDTLELSSVTPGSGMPGPSSAAFSLGFNRPEPSPGHLSHLGDPALELSGVSSDSNSGDNGQASGFCLLKFLTSGRDLCCRYTKANDELLLKLQSLRDESRLLAEKVTALKKGLATRDYRRGVSFRVYFYTVCFDIFSKEAGSTDFGGNFASEIAHNIREMFCDPEDYEEKSITSVYDCLDQVAKAVEEHLGNIPLRKSLFSRVSTLDRRQSVKKPNGKGGDSVCYDFDQKAGVAEPLEEGSNCICDCPNGEAKWDLATIAPKLIASICTAQERVLIAVYSITSPDIAETLIEAKDGPYGHPNLDISVVVDKVSVIGASKQASRLAKNEVDVYLFDRPKFQGLQDQKSRQWSLMHDTYAIVIDDELWFSSAGSKTAKFTTNEKLVAVVAESFKRLIVTLPSYRTILKVDAARAFIKRINNAKDRFFLSANTITDDSVIGAIVEAENRVQVMNVRIFVGSEKNLSVLKEKGVFNAYFFHCPDVTENLALIDNTAWCGSSDFIQKEADFETNLERVGFFESLFERLLFRHLRVCHEKSL